MKRLHSFIDTSRTSDLSLLLSRSEDDFYGSLQRAHNDAVQPPVATTQEAPMIYSVQPAGQPLNWVGNARLAIKFFRLRESKLSV